MQQVMGNNPEVVHIWLMVGQYVLVPVALWAANTIKKAIIEDVKQHVDKTMATHESGEATKFGELSDRIGRIETILMKQGAQKAASARRASKSA